MRREVAGGARSRVLEIGCGTDANFAYYGDAAQSVIATEPDPFMMRRARRRVVEGDLHTELGFAAAHDLPFAERPFDTVVSTANMCTVPNVARALEEIRRVLRPGGEYRFFDHVRYENAFAAFCQDLATPLWRWFGAGCHPNRDIARTIRDSGLAIRELKAVRPMPPVPPMIISRPCIQGIATAR